MAVTYLLRKRAVPYRTRLTGRLMFLNEGFGVARRTPRQFQPRSATIFSSNAINVSGAVTLGEWLASIS
jgi:hypothetical protein